MYMHTEGAKSFGIDYVKAVLKITFYYPHNPKAVSTHRNGEGKRGHNQKKTETSTKSTWYEKQAGCTRQYNKHTGQCRTSLYKHILKYQEMKVKRCRKSNRVTLPFHSMSIFLRDNELDVTMGSVHVVFLLHKKDGEAFLWPSLRQQPKNANIQGILGKRTEAFLKEWCTVMVLSNAR